MLSAKIRIHKREAFELALVHGLKQVLICRCKLWHLHSEIWIKVLGIMI